MKIVNKKIFILRIFELIIVIVTIILTILSFKYAQAQRHSTEVIGGEGTIPFFGLLTIVCLEDEFDK